MIRQLRKSLVWYAFVAPTFILFALFVVYPAFESFRLSVFREVVTRQEFAGFTQYGRLLSNEVFRGALVNTVVLGVAFLVLVIPLALVVASLVNTLKHGVHAFKVIYFLPQVTSTVAVALIFSYALNPDWGLVNGILRALGFTSVPLWFADPTLSLTGSRAGATLLAVWVALGYYMLIFLAGLQGIPAELYEAARIDGASLFQSWRYITLPSLRPTFIFLILTGTIDALARFSDVWTLGGPGGSPAGSLRTIMLYMYQVAFSTQDFNLASAVAVVLLLIMLSVTIVNFRIFLGREFAGR